MFSKPKQKRRSQQDLKSALQCYSADRRLGFHTLKTWKNLVASLRQNLSDSDHVTVVGAVTALRNGIDILGDGEKSDVERDWDRLLDDIGVFCGGGSGGEHLVGLLKDEGIGVKVREVIDLDDENEVEGRKADEAEIDEVGVDEVEEVKNVEEVEIVEIGTKRNIGAASSPGRRDGIKRRKDREKGNAKEQRERVPKEMPFYLLRLRGESKKESNVSLSELVVPNYEFGFVSDYMFDIPWLARECPQLFPADSRQKLVIACGDNAQVHKMQLLPLRHEHITIFKPSLPLQYGTHHTKMMIFFYGERGCRVVVHTANMIEQDWVFKTQAAYLRDFPMKDVGATVSSFESDLLQYLNSLGPQARVIGEIASRYNFENAGVALVCSAPGVHKGADINKWGHMRLRKLLEKEELDIKSHAPVVCQFTSLGSISSNWLKQFEQTVFTRKVRGLKRLGSRRDTGKLELVYPTVAQVALSVEGWMAGASIPVRRKNIERPHLMEKLCEWKCSSKDIRRQSAMPHMKCYLRYSAIKPERLWWLLLTSSNLSQAAHGALQKSGTQLRVLSYEAGVLYLPSLYKNANFSVSQDSPHFVDRPLTRAVHFRTMSPNHHLELSDEDAELIEMPLPFSLPPVPYCYQTTPWHVDPASPFVVPGCNNFNGFI